MTLFVHFFHTNRVPKENTFSYSLPSHFLSNLSLANNIRLFYNALIFSLYIIVSNELGHFIIRIASTRAHVVTFYCQTILKCKRGKKYGCFIPVFLLGSY